MFVEAVLWIARTGSPWRELPSIFGKWNSVFVRFNRWSQGGVWQRIFAALAGDPGFEYLIVDSTIVPVHPHGAGAKGGLKIRPTARRPAAWPAKITWQVPVRGWRKRGTQNQAIGRSRGGLTSKIHLAVRGLGLPVRYLLTAGQRNDITQAKALIDGLPAEWVLADTAFDADHFRADVKAINAQAVIPSHPSRAQKLPLDIDVYKERHLVECCFNKLKHFRRIATRYEKTARNFLAIITVAAIVLWLR